MRRFFRILKWCLLAVLAIAGVFLTVTGIRAAWTGARFEGRIAALRAAGEPLSLPDLTRGPIPPEQNAETYLRRAQEELDAIHKEVFAVYDAAPEDEQEAFDDFRPTSAMQHVMRTALAAHPQAFALVEEASRCPDDDPQIDFNTDTTSYMTSLSPGDRWADVCRVAKYRALVQLADEHPEDALQTCLAMFRLTRLFDRNPSYVNHLVCLAIRGGTARLANVVLRSGPLPQDDYAALEKELASFDVLEGWREALRSERALGLQQFRETAADLAPPQRLLPGFTNDQCDYLDAMAIYIESATLPYNEWRHEYSLSLWPEVGPLTKKILPALQQVHDAAFRTEAELRALRVLNALLQREQAGGAGESALADLGLPANAITDPFNDEPLRLKKLPAGWLIYSVGWNLKDDGGDLTDFLDVGLGPQAPPKAADSGAPPP